MTKAELYDEYWSLRKQGHAIIGAQKVMVDAYGIPWSCITLISHPKIG
jgi:hypothetical protein